MLVLYNNYVSILYIRIAPLAGRIVGKKRYGPWGGGGGGGGQCIKLSWGSGVLGEENMAPRGGQGHRLSCVQGQGHGWMR